MTPVPEDMPVQEPIVANRVFRINFHDSRDTKRYAAAAKKTTKLPSLPLTKRGSDPTATSKGGKPTKSDKATTNLKRSQVISPYLQLF